MNWVLPGTVPACPSLCLLAQIFLGEVQRLENSLDGQHVMLGAVGGRGDCQAQGRGNFVGVFLCDTL